MVQIGTPLSKSAKKVLLLGSGELGKEVAIELQRFGCEVIACDRYEHAPAMQVAHRSYVFTMTDATALRTILEQEQPHFVVPEIEAIATEILVEWELKGNTVIPTARATQLTMNREGIRTLAAHTLELPCSPFEFVNTLEEAQLAGNKIGYPNVIKPLMSSSGKGQSTVKSEAEMNTAWQYAQDGARSAGSGRCIVEGFIKFDYEITMLTVSASDGIFCCPPVGHIQVDGDYRESWQPCQMSKKALLDAQRIAKSVVAELGGYGLFGVELFIRGEEVLFSEVSPRPHDTGLVTLGSQRISEFGLHARAILGLPVGEVELIQPAASVALLGEGNGVPNFLGVDEVLNTPTAQIRLFGKPVCEGKRRLAVVLANGLDAEQARDMAKEAASHLKIELT